MNALVCSDSHGRTGLFLKMLSNERDCPLVFFLGDGLSDLAYAMERYPERQYIYVKGNCDWNGDLPDADVDAYKTVEGTTIALTHGHKYSVKTTLTPLLAHGSDVMAAAVFYGHTHRQDFHYDGGFRAFVLNPGALCMGSYARIEINKYGIEAEFKSVYD